MSEDRRVTEGEFDYKSLYEILDETTMEFRKGEEVVQRETSGVKVTEVFAMPHLSEAVSELEQVDVHFIMVGVDKKKAEEQKEKLLRVLKTYPQQDRLAGGPSYIEVGGVVDSQSAALRLFALGEVLGLWRDITPEKLGVTGPEADELAGRGFVMMTGFQVD